MTQEHALTILKTGANVFLTGEPGSGKTHTINQYVAYLRSHGVEPAITASTGIAATHIHGQTIHSWSGIGIRSTLTPYDIDALTTTEHVVRRIQKTAVLIIDEISMIDAQTLDLVDTVCREVKQRAEPFGGIQVVLVGDFFQLPPVSKGGQEVRFAFESRVWHTMRPIICYLSEQHRQQDKTYTAILSAIRKGEYGEVHHEHLAARHRATDTEHPLDMSVTRLFPHNTDVDAINTQEFNKLHGVPMCFTMTSSGRESLVSALKKGCLSPESLELKIGAVVMCTKNNTQKGYVNGTLGTVTGFEQGTKYPIIETHDGIRIVIEPVDWVVEEDGKQKARITQVPLRLAWAITIHKSQGMSLDTAVMDLSQVFEYGQGYVALSRVRTLERLHLLGWNRRALEIHPRISERDMQFRQQSEQAEVIFADLPKAQVETMQHNFILASGGTITKQKVSHRKKQDRGDTYETTLLMVLQEKPLVVIAKERTYTVATILSHIETLVESKRLATEDIAYLLEPKTARTLDDILHTFRTYDTSKLTPIYEHYKGAYSYEQLRLARMLL